MIWRVLHWTLQFLRTTKRAQNPFFPFLLLANFLECCEIFSMPAWEISNGFPLHIKVWPPLWMQTPCSLYFFCLYSFLVLVHPFSLVLMASASAPNVSMHNKRGIAKPLEEIEGHMMSHIKTRRVWFSSLVSYPFLFLIFCSRLQEILNFTKAPCFDNDFPYYSP